LFARDLPPGGCPVTLTEKTAGRCEKPGAISFGLRHKTSFNELSRVSIHYHPHDDESMKELLPSSDFIRVHRSYFVSKKATTAMDNSFLELGEKKIPIGEKYKTSVTSFFEWMKDEKGIS
jgi:hypothetical protein